MHITSRFAALLVLAIVLGLGAGCARKPDDAKISADVQGRFSQDSGLSTKQLTVQASNGVVTLGGTVDNDAQREAASRQAASVLGVKTVVNNLKVGVATSSAQPSVSTPTSNVAPTGKPKTGVAKNFAKVGAPKDSSADQNPAQENDADENANQMSASNTPPDAAAQTPPAPADTAATQPPPFPAAPKKLIIDPGTPVTVRLIDPIDSERNQAGDTFHATLNAALDSDGEEAVPAGVELTGHLVEVKSAGKFAGQSVVVLQLDSLSSGGKTYSLKTDQYRKEGKSRGKNTAEKVGGGAILGGIIGAIAGGGKGAAIGTAAGAGVGGGVQAASKSQQIKLPSETVLNFTLQEPVEVVQVPSPNANRQKLGDSQ
ncbi:MAG TPA: BON domain-containing protein [Candidatus Sulfotelmatobacter sp.]|nr:BON domain-containing protein [Candidatus Sulfotelmatobacter sp.]